MKKKQTVLWSCNMPKSWLWVIPLTLLWPVLLSWKTVFVAIFYLAKGGHGDNILRTFSLSLIYIPMGLISAIVLIYFWTKSTSKKQKIAILVGYVIGGIAAFLSAELGAMMGLYAPTIPGITDRISMIITGAIGATIGGGIPLVGGTLLGYVIGKK